MFVKASQNFQRLAVLTIGCLFDQLKTPSLKFTFGKAQLLSNKSLCFKMAEFSGLSQQLCCELSVLRDFVARVVS